LRASTTRNVPARDGRRGSGRANHRVAAEPRCAAVASRSTATRWIGCLGHGVRPASGTFRVVLGPQPIAEILNYMVMGSLTTGAFHAASSAYHAKFW